jgi:hypothetical protein
MGRADDGGDLEEVACKFMRAILFELICAASLLAQGPPAEKYQSIKVTKIVIEPTVPEYHYRLGSWWVASCSMPINANEGSEVKYAIEGKVLYIIDGEGKNHECRWIEFSPGFRPRKK